jgi:hypothetical protein
MPADTALATQRSHDPARSLQPLTHEDRESLRRRTVSAPIPLERRRRTVLVAVAATLAALVIGGAGLALYEGVFSTPARVRDDFGIWTKRVPLPPGAHWTKPNLDETGLYGAKAAQMIATGQATCAWFSYWRTALAENDQAGVAAATTGIARVRALLPVHLSGAPEEAGGYSRQSLRFYDRLIREQQAGDARGTTQYLRANCS